MTTRSRALTPWRDDGLVGESDDRLRLYVWQVPVRITHWVTAGCIVVLAITGLYIGDPFLLPPGGRIMGDIRLIHMIAAFTLLVSGMVRVVYLIAGNRFARWSAFIPTSRRQATELFRQGAFYGFLTSHHPKVLGHNQLAAAAYLMLWAFLLVETITGFALDGLLGAEPGASAFWWVRELLGVQTIRLIHHLSMWAVLAIAIFHVYSCVLIDHIERNGLVSSIVSGYKYVTPEDILESRDGGPALLGDRGIVEADLPGDRPAEVVAEPAVEPVMEPVAEPVLERAPEPTTAEAATEPVTDQPSVALAAADGESAPPPDPLPDPGTPPASDLAPDLAPDPETVALSAPPDAPGEPQP
jgi:Ni/Fe-hydrogenase 1 B-type cytochrome subunit